MKEGVGDATARVVKRAHDLPTPPLAPLNGRAAPGEGKILECPGNKRPSSTEGHRKTTEKTEKGAPGLLDKSARRRTDGVKSDLVASASESPTRPRFR